MIWTSECQVVLPMTRFVMRAFVCRVCEGIFPLHKHVCSSTLVCKQCVLKIRRCHMKICIYASKLPTLSWWLSCLISVHTCINIMPPWVLEASEHAPHGFKHIVHHCLGFYAPAHVHLETLSGCWLKSRPIGGECAVQVNAWHFTVKGCKALMAIMPHKRI